MLLYLRDSYIKIRRRAVHRRSSRARVRDGEREREEVLARFKLITMTRSPAAVLRWQSCNPRKIELHGSQRELLGCVESNAPTLYRAKRKWKKKIIMDKKRAENAYTRVYTRSRGKVDISGRYAGGNSEIMCRITWTFARITHRALRSPGKLLLRNLSRMLRDCAWILGNRGS